MYNVLIFFIHKLNNAYAVLNPTMEESNTTDVVLDSERQNFNIAYVMLKY